MISMDTSYSKNVQWPLHQLQAFHPDTLGNPLTHTHSAPRDTSLPNEVEWITFAEFEKRHPVPKRAFYWPLSLAAYYKKAAQEGQARTYVRLNADEVESEEVVRGSVSKSNSTRSTHAAYEVLFAPSEADPGNRYVLLMYYLAHSFSRAEYSVQSTACNPTS